ncbi:unnamed protein product [Notodromas monacha]|uniref:Cortactin-binding protein-2 N-terminal domain-containing protein n=1 Tax=Notodromas monacha TaxID=399045 RepID=A0A7R9BFV7_9CRUS|nr:unnamed protein product [Notodromas monacha]CAG0913739.1 unnamed protein product [Notodromas monacha]
MASKLMSAADQQQSSGRGTDSTLSAAAMKVRTAVYKYLLKTNNKSELSKQDLLQLLSCFEGELQARDIVIATLKMEKVKQVVKLQQQGRLSRGLGAVCDPFAALQRDSPYAVLKSCDHLSSVEEESSVYDNQLEKLEQLILQQRKAMARLTAHLKQAEKINAKVIAELEDERRKHEHDTAQGDDVTYALEKERTKLAAELDVELLSKKKLEKEFKKVKETLEEERSRQQQIVLLLVAERNKIIMKWIEERRRSEDLAQILAEEKGRVDSMAEGLEEESKKALLMEAELERMAAQCSMEQRQFRAQLEIKEKRCKDLEVELEKSRTEAENLHKQLAEAHQVAMFQAGVQSNQGRLHTSPRPVATPPVPSKPAVVPPGPQIPQRSLSIAECGGSSLGSHTSSLV